MRLRSKAPDPLVATDRSGADERSLMLVRLDAGPQEFVK